MTPRARRKGRGHWPPNLYATKNPRGQYFYYLRPDLPSKHPDRFNKFGYVSEREAIDAARQLNQVFGAGGDLVEGILAARRRAESGTLLGDYVDTFLGKMLPERRINGHPLSAHTMSEYKRLYGHIKAKLGQHHMRALTQSDLAEFLNEIGSTAEVFNKYRTRLIDLLKHAVSDGELAENLASRILPRDKELKRRQRITLPGDKPGTAQLDGVDAYRAIWAQATREVRCAMELSLNALQRREEVHRWRFDWSREDADGRHVYIRISKTHKHGISAYIRVPESLPVAHSEFGAQTLGDLIGCCRDHIHSPHLVHRLPKRVKRADGREHPFQLRPQQITKGFAAARDATGLYDRLPADQRPSFHELLALGEHLRERQGWTAQQIQRVRGHTQESTTKLYLEGHEYTTIEVPKR